MKIDNITFYEGLEVVLHNRVRAWYERHPLEWQAPRVTIKFSHSGWRELRYTIPKSENMTCDRRGALRLYGGIRCVEHHGKWTHQKPYLIRIAKR